MSYWIRQDDITNVFYFSNGIISQTSEGVGKIGTAFSSFVGMNSFSGAAADGIKAYIAEVHLTTLLSIGEIFTEFNSKFLLYRDGYFSIDDNSHAQLHEETLFTNETFYTTNRLDVMGKSEDLQGVIDSIADIFPCSLPSVAAVESDCTHIATTLNQLNQSAGDYEQTHLSDFDNLDRMISSLSAFIDNYSGGRSMGSYQPGDVMSLPCFNNLLTAVNDASKARNTEENKRVLSIASEHEEVRYKQLVEELAEQREADGMWMAISSGFEVVGGLFVIGVSTVSLVATCGAAAPLAVPGIIGGLGMVVHGVSNMYQGINEMQLGRTGNPFAVASNPIRDTIFCGNQTAWDIFELASNICGIIGSAGASGYLTATKAGIDTAAGVYRVAFTNIGKSLLSVGAGAGTNCGVNKLFEANGWNTNMGRYAALGVSIVAGMASYGALSAFDKATNISGLYPEKISDTNPANGSLSNEQARRWYLEKEATISDSIDHNASLEEQAHQAFELRNEYRAKARELMANREEAAKLNATEPNKTWDEIVQKQIDKGYAGDEIYKSILESAQRSRPEVNNSLDLDPNNLPKMKYPLKPSDYLRGALDGSVGSEIGEEANEY